MRVISSYSSLSILKPTVKRDQTASVFTTYKARNFNFVVFYGKISQTKCRTFLVFLNLYIRQTVFYLPKVLKQFLLNIIF